MYNKETKQSYMFFFNIKDLKIEEKYSFFIEELSCVDFFIEVKKKDLINTIENEIYNYKKTPLDMIWKIGYYDLFGKVFKKFWLDMLERIIPILDCHDIDLYIDFQNVFEDQCVEIVKYFEEEIWKNIYLEWKNAYLEKAERHQMLERI